MAEAHQDRQVEFYRITLQPLRVFGCVRVSSTGVMSTHIYIYMPLFYSKHVCQFITHPLLFYIPHSSLRFYPGPSPL